MLTIIAILVALPFTILTLAFAIEVAAGLSSRAVSIVADRRPDTVIMIPAHDEAAIIGVSLAELRSEIGPAMRMLVVADNCADDTARIARACGAEVIERSDTVRRGKGFALAFARDHLSTAPPECVIILDADCSIDRAALDALANRAMTHDRPVQSVYLLRPDIQAAPMVQVSNFAFALKNLVRQRGLERLSGRVNLTGTGMAFPWRLLASAPLATNDVVEDLGLGLDMAKAGAPPLLATDAFVWSRSSDTRGTLTQRTRWEGGFLSTSLRRAPASMRDGLRRGDPRALWAGLSLMIPPLALLTLVNAAAMLVGAGLVMLGASAVPLMIQAAVGACAAASVITAWFRMGRPYLSPAASARLPIYLFWKLPMYFGLLRRTPKTWLRTGR